MSEDQKLKICLHVTIAFLLTGLTGVGMAGYVSVFGYEDLSHSALVEMIEYVIGGDNDHC